MASVLALVAPAIRMVFAPTDLSPRAYVHEIEKSVVVEIPSRGKTYLLVAPEELSDGTFKTLVMPRLEAIVRSR